MLTAFVALFTLAISGPFAYLAIKLPMPTPYKILYLGVIVLVAGLTILLSRQPI